MTLWWPLDGPDDPDGSPSPPTVTVYSLLAVDAIRVVDRLVPV